MTYGVGVIEFLWPKIRYNILVLKFIYFRNSTLLYVLKWHIGHTSNLYLQIIVWSKLGTNPQVVARLSKPTNCNTIVERGVITCFYNRCYNMFFVGEMKRISDLFFKILGICTPCRWNYLGFYYFQLIKRFHSWWCDTICLGFCLVFCPNRVSCMSSSSSPWVLSNVGLENIPKRKSFTKKFAILKEEGLLEYLTRAGWHVLTLLLMCVPLWAVNIW